MPLLPDFHIRRYFAPGDTNVLLGQPPFNLNRGKFVHVADIF